MPLAQDDPDSGSRFTALRQFALEACTADCGSAERDLDAVLHLARRRVPGRAPRPVAPTLTMREFDVPDTQAAAVRLVDAGEPVHRQVPATPGSRTPTRPTTPTARPRSDRGTIVHAAELQVFATESGSTVAVPGTTPPTTAPTTHADDAPRAPRPGATTPTTTGRVPTRVKLRVFRSVQTPANAAPQLRARLRLDGARDDRLGRWIVKLDGRRYRLVTVDRLTLTPARDAAARTRPAPSAGASSGPTDRTAYAPSKSAAVRIVVRR